DLSCPSPSRRDRPDPPAFPTRRSSDLSGLQDRNRLGPSDSLLCAATLSVGERSAHAGGKYRSVRRARRRSGPVHGSLAGPKAGRDRKSTRLNSSHVKISYAVFCLKKKH